MGSICTFLITMRCSSFAEKNSSAGAPATHLLPDHGWRNQISHFVFEQADLTYSGFQDPLTRLSLWSTIGGHAKH
jgi:hypothetical protein